MTPSPDSPQTPSERKPAAVPPAWRRLVVAAQAARQQASAGRDDAAPFGFSTRVVARWRQARDEERRLALWQRLSWRAAFASLTLCAAVVVAQRGGPGASAPPLLQPPSIDLPAL